MFSCVSLLSVPREDNVERAHRQRDLASGHCHTWRRFWSGVRVRRLPKRGAAYAANTPTTSRFLLECTTRLADRHCGAQLQNIIGVRKQPEEGVTVEVQGK